MKGNKENNRRKCIEMMKLTLIYNSTLYLCGSYQDFFDIGLLVTRKLLNQGFLLVKLFQSHHFESFMVATMTWLTVMEYLCHK